MRGVGVIMGKNEEKDDGSWMNGDEDFSMHTDAQ